MLAYTNRFLAIANIIRILHNRYKAEGQSQIVGRQIDNLRSRLGLIRWMQSFGILSLIVCICSVVVLFLEQPFLGALLFGGSLLLMLVSLVFCLMEIQLSGRALEIELEDISK